jgi:hypothetical protein
MWTSSNGRQHIAGNQGPPRGTRGRRAIALVDAGTGCASPADGRERLLEALDAVPPDGVLEIRFGFDPTALIATAAERGFHAEVAVRGAAGWVLAVRAPGAPEILDLRDLEAPEPLERILEACAALPPGAGLLARTPRPPRMLLPQLERRALAWEVIEEPDRSGLVWVQRPR